MVALVVGRALAGAAARNGVRAFTRRPPVGPLPRPLPGVPGVSAPGGAGTGGAASASGLSPLLLFLGPKLAIGALLAWGIYNAFKEGSQGEPDGSFLAESKVAPAGGIDIDYVVTRGGSDVLRCSDNSLVTARAPFSTARSAFFSVADQIRILEVNEEYPAGFACEATGLSNVPAVRLEWHNPSDDSWNLWEGFTLSARGQNSGRYDSPEIFWQTTYPEITSRTTGEDLRELAPGEDTLTLLPTPALPPSVPLAPAAPKPGRRTPIAPAFRPLAPGVSPDAAPVPGTAPTPAQAPEPATAPGPSIAIPSLFIPPLTPLPVPVPGAVPVQVPGVPAPVAQAPPVKPTRPGDRKIAGIGIIGPQRDVPPTIQSVAAETGRIERKLEHLMKNPPDVSPLADVIELLQQLYDLIFALDSGGEYLLTSECRRDENGDPLDPVAVQFSGAISSFGALANRIDAIAQLLQVHKDMPTHVCRRQPPEGQRVWVTFDVDP